MPPCNALNPHTDVLLNFQIGARLFVNGILLIDRFDDRVQVSAGTPKHEEHEATVELEQGVLYDIIADFREDTGTAEFSLMWQQPWPKQERVAIPSANLYPTTDAIKGSPFKMTSYRNNTNALLEGLY